MGDTGGMVDALEKLGVGRMVSFSCHLFHWTRSRPSHEEQGCGPSGQAGVGNKKITLRLSLLGTEGQSSQLEIMDLDNLGNIVLSLKKEISIRF